MGDEEEVTTPLEEITTQERVKKGLELKRLREEEDTLIAEAEEWLAEQPEPEPVEVEEEEEPDEEVVEETASDDTASDDEDLFK